MAIHWTRTFTTDILACSTKPERQHVRRKGKSCHGDVITGTETRHGIKAASCNTGDQVSSFLQAEYCNVRQRTAIYGNVLRCMAMYCNILRCMAMYCNSLQCTAIYCDVRQCTAMYGNVLQYMAMYGKHQNENCASRVHSKRTSRGKKK